MHIYFWLQTKIEILFTLQINTFTQLLTSCCYKAARLAADGKVSLSIQFGPELNILIII